MALLIKEEVSSPNFPNTPAQHSQSKYQSLVFNAICKLTAHISSSFFLPEAELQMPEEMKTHSSHSPGYPDFFRVFT